ncbi:hypothetical protein A9Q86_08950 [Flavobacteriales bacterium 33_180_T64]|nr:hypothetical protein A9Q86_08950 [Flavobacteriales bacterium 33_180_T64]
MKKIYLTIFCCIALIGSVSSQNAADQKKIEKYEEEVERKKQNYINDFLATLNIDDFQKEIIKQSMNSYFIELTKVNKLRLQGFQRTAAIERLDEAHFKDVKTIVSEDIMAKIMDAIKGKWNQKAERKAEKKKRKRKN